MLYISTWNRKSVRELLTVENLVSWLKTQNPKTKYSYINGPTCLITRYLRDNGYADATTGGYYVRIDGEREYALPAILNDIAKHDKPFFKRRTFGGALKEAERHLNKGVR